MIDKLIAALPVITMAALVVAAVVISAIVFPFGIVAIIVILLLAPVGILMSTTLFAGVLGTLLNNDVDTSHEGSELLDLAETGMSVKPE